MILKRLSLRVRKKEEKSLKVFAVICISFMQGRNVNYWAMGGVVRKIYIAKQLVKMHFFDFFFFAIITNMFAKAVCIFIHIYWSKTVSQFLFRSTSGWVVILAE